MSQTSIKRAPVEAFFDASTIQYCPEDPDSIVIQLWHDYRWSPGRQRLHRGLDPPVLAELDALKVGQSSPEVREKPASSAGGSRSGVGAASCTVASRCRDGAALAVSGLLIPAAWRPVSLMRPQDRNRTL
jgi:hypothetical protein